MTLGWAIIEKTPVVLASTAGVVNDYLRSLLSGSPRLEVVGEPRDIGELRALLLKHNHGIAMVGQRFVPALASVIPQLKHLKLVVTVPPQPMPPTVWPQLPANTAALAVGSMNAADIVKTLLLVDANMAVIPRSLLPEELRPSPSEALASCGLSARELAVIQASAQGLSDAEINELLYIAQRTIHTYIDRAKAKLNATNRAHLVAKVAALERSPTTDWGPTTSPYAVVILSTGGVEADAWAAAIQAAPELHLLGCTDNREGAAGLLNSHPRALILTSGSEFDDAICRHVRTGRNVKLVYVTGRPIVGKTMPPTTEAVLTWDLHASDLVAALQLIAKDFVVLPAEMAPFAFAHRSWDAPRPSGHGKLLPRELELLGYMANGISESQVSQLMQLSRRSIHANADRIRAKLGTRTRVQAVSWAVASGLISIDEAHANVVHLEPQLSGLELETMEEVF